MGLFHCWATLSLQWWLLISVDCRLHKLKVPPIVYLDDTVAMNGTPHSLGLSVATVLIISHAQIDEEQQRGIFVPNDVHTSTHLQKGQMLQEHLQWKNHRHKTIFE